MSTDNKTIKYPVGIQSFEKLRTNGFLYVDKTAILHKLIENSGYYFLSRPRRFGKSLTISTLEAYYRGRRDLFKGLAIDSLTEEWDSHPVLHLDLNNGTYNSVDGLNEILSNHLDQWEKEYGQLVKDQERRSPSIRFGNVIRSAYDNTGRKVVVLVDEYDKPLLNSFGRPELTEQYREELKAFYSNLKTMDAYIEMGFLTGVARFSKVSIFSDLNNLRDISFTNEYSAICGVTYEELIKYFRKGMDSIAGETGQSLEEVAEELRCNFDGYHFSPKSKDIYNPYSLVYSFANKELGYHWADTGTPGFLVRLMQREEWNISDLAPCEFGKAQLESAGVMSDNPIPVLYQTGYLTIKSFDPTFQTYLLDYPNREVRHSFLEFLVPYYLYPDKRQTPFSIKNFVKEVMEGNAWAFMKRLASLIAGVPYSDRGSAEAHFQNAIFLLFNLMGFYCKMEERTSDGRIDILVENRDHIFIIEFKIDSSSRSAMDQIEEKRYWLPYLHSGKEIILIGANFNTKTRRLDDDPVIRRVQE